MQPDLTGPGLLLENPTMKPIVSSASYAVLVATCIDAILALSYASWILLHILGHIPLQQSCITLQTTFAIFELTTVINTTHHTCNNGFSSSQRYCSIVQITSRRVAGRIFLMNFVLLTFPCREMIKLSIHIWRFQNKSIYMQKTRRLCYACIV